MPAINVSWYQAVCRVLTDCFPAQIEEAVLLYRNDNITVRSHVAAEITHNLKFQEIADARRQLQGV